MANHCYNELTITGIPVSLQTLLDFVNSNGGVLDFNRIIPYPLEFNDVEEVDWRIEHWGTKWNATNPSLKWENAGKIIFEFDTAWSPSIPITVALSERYPDLVFVHHYDVSRMECRGTATIVNGEMIDHIKWKHSDFPDTDENE
jgi:hypothetical protein